PIGLPPSMKRTLPYRAFLNFNKTAKFRLKSSIPKPRPINLYAAQSSRAAISIVHKCFDFLLLLFSQGRASLDELLNLPSAKRNEEPGQKKAMAIQFKPMINDIVSAISLALVRCQQ